MQKILRNAIRCRHCGDVIETTFRHHFVTCSCRYCSVDGGYDYMRRSFKNSKADYEELSETIEVNSE